MNFDAAFVKENGVEIGIFATTMDVINDKMQAENLITYCEERILAGYQVVLMAQDSQGVPHYYGRQDLTRILEATNFSKIHFRRYTKP
ncbi:MAG: hypothetical protein AB7U98_11770 [Candidatus Nitrosocosmicus sp.]|jgi:hypothetical protein|nr:hypothetical protein [Candidatus Nitrosocosmicus sp.]GKS62564.1 hypothetical protein YTPLAS21_20220 [Candidatus Nitrosocosmicus sp.]